MTVATSSCLIRYIEVWKPNADGGVELESCHIVDDNGMNEIASSVRALASGEGIAGSALQQRAPVIFQDMPSVDLGRVRNQSGIDISAVLAFPVFDDQDLVNVVAFGFTDGDGAVEVWSRDDRDELSISASFYRGLESFEFISQYVRFPKGAGLPGACWKSSRAMMLNDPASNPNFIRSFDRDRAELSAVVGMPVSREYGFPNAVMLWLSSESMPLARSIAIAKAQSEAPSEQTPLPAVSLTNIESSTAESNQLSWHASVAELVGSTRSSVMFSPENSEASCAGIAVPCFVEKAIDRIVFLTFYQSP